MVFVLLNVVVHAVRAPTQSRYLHSLCSRLYDLVVVCAEAGRPREGWHIPSWGNVLRARSALTRTYCQLDLHHQLNGDEFRTYSEACQSFNRAEAAMVLAQKPFQWVVTPTYSGNTIPPPPASVRLSKRKWVVPFGGLAQLPTRASPPGGVVFA